MRRLRCCILILATALASAAVPRAMGHPAQAIFLAPGQAFCPSRIVVVGAVTLRKDRCFSVLLVKTAASAFFAFAPAESFATIPNQAIAIRTPRGVALARRIFLALPIVVARTSIPIGTLQAVPVIVEEAGATLNVRLAMDPTIVATVVPARASSGVLVPDDVRIIPPGAGVPRDEAAFSGKWIGQWDGRWRGLFEGSLPHVLVVEELDRDTGFLTSTTRAVVVTSWGAAPSWDVFPGWHRGPGVFERGVLRVSLPGGGLATYRMSIDGTLDATYAGSELGVLRAAMRRLTD